MADSEWEELTTEELRGRAFAVARGRRDLRFFWDILVHVPHAHRAEEVDGSLGSVGPAIDDALEMWRELHGRDYGDEEPLLRSAFIDYLDHHSERGGAEGDIDSVSR